MRAPPNTQAALSSAASPTPLRAGRLPRPRSRLDTGMLTVNGGLRIHLAPPLADAIQTDALDRPSYGRQSPRQVILLPNGAQAPARKYLDWHPQKVFIP